MDIAKSYPELIIGFLWWVIYVEIAVIAILALYVTFVFFGRKSRPRDIDRRQTATVKHETEMVSPHIRDESNVISIAAARIIRTIKEEEDAGSFNFSRLQGGDDDGPKAA